MRKVIENNTIYFYDDNDCEIMNMDHSIDECTWYFYSDDVILVTPDMELYSVLDNFMNQEYIFPNDTLLNYKDKNKLVWYSDCYYNPDDEWSIASVSCLNIEKIDEGFKIWCTKKLDEKINRVNKTYCICFSPSGNGNYNRNLKTGYTLQDDFVRMVYQPLLQKAKVLKK